MLSQFSRIYYNNQFERAHKAQQQRKRDEERKQLRKIPKLHFL